MVQPQQQLTPLQVVEKVKIEGDGVSDSVYLGIPASFSIIFGDQKPINPEEIEVVFQDELGNIYTQVESLVSAADTSNALGGRSSKFSVSYIPYEAGKMFVQMYMGDSVLSAVPFVVNVVPPRTCFDLTAANCLATPHPAYCTAAGKGTSQAFVNQLSVADLILRDETNSFAAGFVEVFFGDEQGNSVESVELRV